MLKKLRRKIILVNMSIVLILLLATFSLIYLFTSANIERESMRAFRDMSAPMAQWHQGNMPFGPTQPFVMIKIHNDMTITVITGNDDILPENTSITNITEQILASGRPVGTITDYKVRFNTLPSQEGQLIILTDISEEINALSEIRIRLFLLALLCFVVFLLISILLAFWVTRPVEKAWQQQKQFVSDASHELKTPLTVILTNAELLQYPELDEQELSQYSESILIMSRRMRSLTERLLELARSDNDIHNHPFTNVDISRIVNEAILPFDPLFYEKGLTLEAHIEDGITIKGNEEQLRQVTDILLDNARKYSNTSGTIRIRLEKKNKNRLLFSVSNPGEALSDQEKREIFKRFYRIDKARTGGSGFGLGLSIAESIITRHHGTIKVESKDGINTFSIELPIRS